MEKISSQLLQTMIESAAHNLCNNSKMVNDLNVFPVPDGDTGTNMSLTFSGAEAIYEKSDNIGNMARSLASSALRNARGNSGVILSQILRGISKGLDGVEEATVVDIKNAVVGGRDSAYRAVMRPTEGTILTVIREMAEFAEANFDGQSEADTFLRLIYDAGQESLKKTQTMLPALTQAGVVDAGGMGLMTLFEGMIYVLDNGVAVSEDEPSKAPVSKGTAQAKTDVDIKFQYCTEFIINKEASRKANQFKQAISDKGDCMLVIEDDDIVKVHIHTNHPGFVIEEALKLGELTNLKIDNMKYQHEEKMSADEEVEEAPVELKKYGFVSVSAGSGLSEVFVALGVDQIVEGGQTMNPSTEDLLLAVEKTPAENVFILPNNKNIILAAEQVQELTEKNVIVIPTKNIPQGINAVSSFDEDLTPEVNAENMVESYAEVQCAQVTFAARDTVIDDVEINEGDIMGLYAGEISIVTNDIPTAVKALLEEMVNEDTGVITLYYGEGVTGEDAEALCEELEEIYDELDVSLFKGSQPIYFYIISAE